MGISIEEKWAKKEAKRLQELRAIQEVQKGLRRKELEREITAQALTRKELDKSWKEFFLKINEPVFRQDMEVMWHTFERVLDKKDHEIQYTMKLMKVAENQFQKTILNFCYVIDTMINNFLEELERLSKENDIRTEKYLKCGDIEFGKIVTDQNAAEKHLKLLLFDSHRTADSLAWTIRGVNLVKEDDERMNSLNERVNLRSYLENSYSNMWGEYMRVLKLYVTNTAENQKKMRILRCKENTMADIIASQAKKIKNNAGLLKRLRTELLAYESGTKQAEFRERRDRFRNAYHRLKKMLNDNRTLDEKQMALLVSESNTAIEWLETGYRKSQKLLRLAALCRKFETQREKVLPFAYTIIPSQDARCLRGTQSDVDALSLSRSGLTRLWQKISNVELSKKALLQEQKLLGKENMTLSQKLQVHEENKFIPDAKKCICIRKKNVGTVSKPVAIEGVLELYKYHNI